MKADRNLNTLRHYTSETQCSGTAGEIAGAKAEPPCGAGLVECNGSQGEGQAAPPGIHSPLPVAVHLHPVCS